MNRKLSNHGQIRSDFLGALESGRRILVRLDAEKAFAPSGHNGPHYALETPVRNTCHWIIASLIGWKLSGNPAFRDDADRLARWLLSEHMHRRSGCFLMRQIGSDRTNGVIGPAWVIEALTRLWWYTANIAAAKVAADLARAHSFDRRVGAWRRFDPVTPCMRIDYTFDHQLWFAAAVAEAGEASEEVIRFLDAAVAGGMRVRSSGRIHHLWHASTWRSYATRILYALAERRKPGHQANIEDGYHLYSLFPMVRLNVVYPEHAIFGSPMFERVLAHCDTEAMEALAVSRYGLAYNAPGLELPLVVSCWGQRIPLDDAAVEAIYQRQREVTWEPATGIHACGNPDPMTLTARLYELGLYLEATEIGMEARRRPGVAA